MGMTFWVIPFSIDLQHLSLDNLVLFDKLYGVYGSKQILLANDVDYGYDRVTKPSEFVSQVLTSWQQANLPFVILRNYEGLPEIIGNDIDILIAPDSYYQAVHLMEEAGTATGFHLINRVKGAGITALFYRNNTDLVHFDLATSPRWRFLPIMDTDEILAKRQNAGLYNAPHPVHEAALKLLYRLLLHGYVKDSFKTDIVTTFELEPNRVIEVLEPYFGSDLAKHIVQDVTSRDWSAVERKTSTLRRELIKRHLVRAPFKTGCLAAGYGFQMLERLQRPPGLVIAVTGPMTSENERFAVSLSEKLGSAFMDYSYSERQPRHGPITIIGVVNDLKNLILDGFRFRAKLIKKSLVIVNGYTFALKVALEASANGAPKWLLQLSSPFTLKPDLVFYLDADPVSIARTSNLDADEARQQREAYLRLVEQTPEAYELTLEEPYGELVNAAEQRVFSFLAERVKGDRST